MLGLSQNTDIVHTDDMDLENCMEPCYLVPNIHASLIHFSDNHCMENELDSRLFVHYLQLPTFEFYISIF